MRLNSRGYVDTGFTKYCTTPEYLRIRAYFDTLKSPPMRMCCRLMCYSGLPCADAVELKLENLSPDCRMISKARKKTNLPYVVYLPAGFANELKQYCTRYMDRMKEGYIFFASYHNQSKNPHLTRAALRYVMVKMRRKLGLTDVYYTARNGVKYHRISTHTLRHYIAWRAYATAGNNIIAAKEWLCHKDIKTTVRYINAIESAQMRDDLAERMFNFSNGSVSQ